MARELVRLRVVQVAFGIALVLLLARAGQIQVLDGGEHYATAQAQGTERVELPARRGTIYDRNGVPLALTQEIFRVGVAPNELRDPEEDANTLARHLGVAPRTVRRRLQQSWVHFHGPYTAVQVAPLRSLRGVHPERELVRFYPDPELASVVLGRPEAEGRPASGMERVLDEWLTGVPGQAVVLRDRLGQQIESPSSLSAFPVPGHDVYLTIDAELQEIVERALVDGIERYEAQGGDVVVLNPRTGEILAIASRDAAGRSVASAFTSVFEPGSTAKLFAVGALLTHGLAQPEDSVWTENGEFRFGNRTIHDDHPSGWLTVAGVIEQSSNIGIVKLGQQLSPERQYEMLRDFGLGTPTGVEYPAESPGLLKRPHEWSGTTPASLAMGYEVAVTVLQLAQAYAAVASDGVLVQPTLVREIRRPDGKVAYRHVPAPVRRVVRADVAASLRAMLRGVVYRGGTGETAALSTYEIAGKTGTARRAGPGGYVPGSYVANFASLFPADEPQIVMVVKLDDPRGAYARLTAAPISREVVEQLLAAQSGALDRARLTAEGPTASSDPAIAAGTVPYVVEWPPQEARDPAAPSTVPDVTGSSLRDAARALHRAGLRMQVEGWGTVTRTDPPAGTRLAPGTLVTVTARERGRR
ncbi:MAG: transpeptidase family protein [Gemmatimonadota bacterium]|nr:MAG: transpeptidase family protein [Gemmatimonadota bacterium]